MLAKLTSKNQLTLPKAIASAFPGVSYFEVTEQFRTHRPLTRAPQSRRRGTPQAPGAGDHRAGRHGRNRVGTPATLKRPPRVVLDTNVLVSALILGGELGLADRRLATPAGAPAGEPGNRSGVHGSFSPIRSSACRGKNRRPCWQSTCHGARQSEVAGIACGAPVSGPRRCSVPATRSGGDCGRPADGRPGPAAAERHDSRPDHLTDGHETQTGRSPNTIKRARRPHPATRVTPVASTKRIPGYLYTTGQTCTICCPDPSRSTIGRPTVQDRYGHRS